MALSRIWAAFILISIAVAGIKYVFVPGDREIFGQMVTGKTGDSIGVVAPASLAVGKGDTVAGGVRVVVKKQEADGLLATAATAVTLSLGLIGVMALFMGLVSIAEAAGGMRWLARVTGPFFSKLFPDVPRGHPAMGHMVMNFSANLLGLDNAATPFALKAMESLQEINPDKARASNSQIMFLCLHASGLQVIPISVIALRATMGAPDPTDIFVPIVIATFITTVASMSIVAAWQRINLFQPAVFVWVGGISLVIGGLVVYLHSMTTDHVQAFSRALSGGLILLIFFIIVGVALARKVNIFDAFVQGAKGGFETAVRIIPYLVGMLAAISLLRTSGTFGVGMAGSRY
ncbi:MAG: spore maturation protein, partial [Bacteroidetes bacterium]|nr:spore maturation protein [Bacteroidota bacterium]